MELDLSDWIKPIVVFIACVFGVVVVFCLNALPQFASDEGNKKRPVVYLVWLVVILVSVFGLLTFFYILKHK